jgi:ankyrin repeat protein
MDKDTPADSKGKSTQGASASGHNTSGKANDGEHVSLKMTETQWNDKFKAAADENNDKTVEELLCKRPIVHTGWGSKEHKDSDKDVVVAALFDAIRRGQVPMVKTIIRSKEFKWGHRYGDLERTALHEAVDVEKEDIVRELLRHSESAKYIDLGDAYRRTALHIAASKGNRVIMKYLLSNQADVDARDHQEMSPLHMAVWENSSNLDKYRDAVKLLLENGAKVNTRDQSRKTPAIHISAFNHDHRGTRLLS